MNRLRWLLVELVPGQRKRDLAALQAKAILASVRPRDLAGKTRRRMAAEELADLFAVDALLKKTKSELRAAVLTRGSSLTDITGVGPAGQPRGRPPRRASPVRRTKAPRPRRGYGASVTR